MPSVFDVYAVGRSAAAVTREQRVGRNEVKEEERRTIAGVAPLVRGRAARNIRAEC